ncbi:EAL domain-containing protein [Peribacillus sp. SCS-155]|uniref:EAL domain-containing protein n=1 Tax=Peribacillus sedimenti TaxID=3115297 RepID=UPI0039067517
MEQAKILLKTELQQFQKSEGMEKFIIDIIFKHVRDFLIIVKVEEGRRFRYLFANETALKHAGLSQGFIGELVEDVLPKKLSRQIYRQYSRVFGREEDISYRDEIIHNGTKLFGETVLNAVRDEQGVVRYIVSVTRDMTAAVQEKKRMIESQHRYKSVIDHNLDAIFSLDQKGVILSANPASYQIIGYTQKQLTGRSIFHLLEDEDVPHFQRRFKETMDGYSKECQHCRFIHKKGRLLRVHLKTIPIVIHGEINGVYVIMRDITEQTVNMEKISYMAYHDQLTGLYNRTALIRDIKIEIFKNESCKKEFSLFSIDLDRFKYLNDTLGHEAGDLMLKKVAERLLSLEGYEYNVYRQGGDEFNILLKKGDGKTANDFAAEIFKTFHPSFQLMLLDYFITPSIGISTYPHDGNESELLIRRADAALYQVKARGKAHHQFYNKEMNVHVPGMVAMESHLRRAVENGELAVFYQPQVDLNSNQVCSFEALIRWDNPVLGFVHPGEFIPLAEDTGLIIPIGEWLIEEVCRQIRVWKERGVPDIKIGINLSPKQFLQPNLCEIILRSIQANSICPSNLEIEITEGAMQDAGETIKILKDMKQMGLTISVDDFGTGYSSLNYLKQLPLDTLKIDQSFIREILTDQKGAAITTTIIHLAHSLDLEVIAEGVETGEQAEYLKANKCKKAQGYLYSRPLPAKEIETLFL